ncbi:MAG: hypothetical protein KQH83_05890 [Actinobacteria bacterium]|nr:hypothetical protein [Actinomycetota bacterium]
MSRRGIVVSVVAAAGLVAAMYHGSSLMAAQQAAEYGTGEARAIAEEMLQAFSAGDYAAFSVEFTGAYRETLDEAAFEAWREPLAASLGAYGGIVEESDPKQTSTGATRYTFHASFDGDDRVQFVFVTKPGTRAINRVELKPDK